MGATAGAAPPAPRRQRGREPAVRLYGHTSQGTARAHNEDSLAFNGQAHSLHKRKSVHADEPAMPALAAVADGLGGHPGGEIASALALQSLLASFAASPARFSPQAAIAKAHQAICSAADEQRAHAGMGTTVAGFVLDGGLATVFSVGDSRTYLAAGTNIRRLTKIDRDAHDMITQCLGVARQPAPRVHVAQVQPKPGDLLLAISDGVSDGLADELIARTAAAGRHSPAEALCDAARRAGSTDDTSAAVAAYQPYEPARPRAAR